MRYPHLKWTSAREVTEGMALAMAEGRGFAVVRLGDGEALMLAHNLLFPAAEALRRGPFLPCAGVELPDLAGRDRVAAAVRRADIVGISPSLKADYFPLLWPALSAHGIDVTQLRVATATVNYDMHSEGHLRHLLLDLREKPRVLVVGNTAQPLGQTLEEQGVLLAGCISPVNGVRDVDRVLEEMHRYQYDVALVAAGVAAVVIAVEVARAQNRVALDFGHLADELVSGQKSLALPANPQVIAAAPPPGERPHPPDSRFIRLRRGTKR